MTGIAFKHSQFWGRNFYLLEGINSKAEVSYAYLFRKKRFIYFHLFQIMLLFLIWKIFPINNWGLFSILISAWGYKSGIRIETLRYFVFYLILYLEENNNYDLAWDKAKSVVTTTTGVKNIFINMHKDNPNRLIKYVISTTRNKDESNKIKTKWEKLNKE
jgi:hypothetical protein